MADAQPKNDTPESDAQKRIAEAERIQALRERLYARTGGVSETERHSLASMPTKNVTTPLPPQHSASNAASAPSPHTSTQEEVSVTHMTISPKRRSFRFKLALFGLLFFLGAIGVSGFFLYTGNNTISGDNITIGITGPLTVGGGEDLSIQIAIANQNALPIESATLIIEYPKGTQSFAEEGKELYTERQQLNNIESGEAINVPIHVRMFGEENEEKFINVSVEYRVRGSNATFEKTAEPYRFKISTSPVILNIDSVDQVPSGQEIDVDITVQSNSPTTLRNVLVQAEYPSGFDYTGAKPEPVSGRNVWRIDTLEPGEKKKITVTGVLVGVEKVPERFMFEVGMAHERDRFTLSSPLMSITEDVNIEKPFLDVVVKINNEIDETVTISNKDIASVNVTFKNALETTMYDGRIHIELGGNALNEIDVRVIDGHYDSTANTITWDSVDVSELRELAPGASHVVSFTLDPRDDVQSTPEVHMKVGIEGNRLLEGRVSEKVTDTTTRTVKVASVASLASSAVYTEGPFTNTGPIPPVTEKTTQYTLLMTVHNSTNDISDAEVTAVLPQYMTWLDMVSENDTVTYTPSTRTIRWNIGNMSARGYEEVWIQVAFTPSLSQVDTVPTILETQRFKAVDRFTGAIIRDDASALTTALPQDPDESRRDGRVQGASVDE